MAGQPSKGTRVIALVGPAGAGKTSLAEAMLFAAGATDRLGSTANGSSIGDSSPEARQRGGSTELNLYNFQYLGDDFAILDVPGSIGFSADGAKALAIADVAIVVVDPDPARAPLAAPALRALDELGIPHLIFVNRIDQAHGRIRDLLTALQPISVSPLIGRQIPIWDGEKISGFVDLALEYAFKYRAGQESERIDIPTDLQAREAEARTHMLEQLADHDDELLEQLLMDESPAREKILQDLARETGENLGVSVLFGSAISSWGVRRLLKAIRHEAPDAAATANRLGVDSAALYIFKIVHGAIGRLALARALGGRIAEGSDLKTSDGGHARVGSLFKVQGEKTVKVTEARDGEEVRPGLVLVAPAGRHLTFHRDAHGKVVTRLDVRPLDTSHRPSVDVMFQSAAEVYGERVLGVVMTGMGADGRDGAAWIKARGGSILTEAEESCVVYGMPRAVVEAGLSDEMIPLERLTTAIMQRI